MGGVEPRFIRSSNDTGLDPKVARRIVRFSNDTALNVRVPCRIVRHSNDTRVDYWVERRFVRRHPIRLYRALDVLYTSAISNPGRAGPGSHSLKRLPGMLTVNRLAGIGVVWYRA